MRLAVDEDYQGLGGSILLDAMGRALAGSRAVASHAVIVDAKNEQARAFYAHYGILRQTERDGCYSMSTVEKLFTGR